MKLIPLTQGKFAMVDDEDYDFLNQWKWYASPGRNTFYAKRRYNNKDGIRVTDIMHRIILKLNDPKIQGDHKDNNGLNNQKNNLRIATQIQNSHNVTSRPNSTSKYLGVSWDKERNKWTAQLTINRKRVSLGRFLKEEDAAIAWNEASKKHHGEFIKLNTI